MITPFLPDEPTATDAPDIGTIEPPIETNRYRLIAEPSGEYNLRQNLLLGFNNLFYRAFLGWPVGALI